MYYLSALSLHMPLLPACFQWYEVGELVMGQTSSTTAALLHCFQYEDQYEDQDEDQYEDQCLQVNSRQQQASDKTLVSLQ